MPSRLSKQDCSQASIGFTGELVTSSDLTPPPGLQEDNSVKSDALYIAAKMHSSHQPNSSAAPSMDGQQEVTSIAEQDIQTGSATKRPMLSSKDSEGKFRRVLSGIFKKSSHQNADTAQHEETTPPFSKSPSDHEKERRKTPFRKTPPKTSPSSIRSNTSPSPGSQKDNVPMVPPIRFQEPSQESIPTRGRPRAFTLSFRDKLHWHRHTPVGPEVQLGHGLQRGRSTSADPTSRTQSVTLSQNSEAPLLERQIIQMAADSGTGLKARRLSITLTEDLQVIPTELYTEYCDQSKLIGRRGKSVGKGATATVRLMNKKGGYSGEVFAVKKFRGKSRNENQEEYEQKVKSEYTIAKSVHHPNIVETFRLCTYNGRWNQVMEFCDQGDLFNLVKQGHLQKEDHLKDRVCLFKQLVQGIHYLHNHGIAHRDIKLENILITKDSKLKITDFGISEVFAGIHPGLREAHGQCGKDMGEARLCTPGMCGSPPYAAPEVIAKLGKYDPRPLDVWGAAVVMICLSAGAPFWNIAKPGNSPQYDQLVSGWNRWNLKHQDSDDTKPNERDYPHVSCLDLFINPPALRRIIVSMLNPDPCKRATMAGIVKNGWFKAQDCCQVDSYEDPANTIDASKIDSSKTKCRIIQHNHLAKHEKGGHHLIRVPREG